MSVFDRSLEAHVAGRLEEAESGYREVLAEHPRHADALHLLGLIRRDRGALDEAETLIAQAISLHEQARFVGSLGSVLLDRGRGADAEAMFRRAITLDPRDAYAHYNLGILLLDLARAGEAEGVLRQALALDGNLPGTHRNLGRAMYMLGRHDEAQASFRRAIGHRPDDAAAHVGLAATLATIGRLDEAKAAADDAIRLDSRSFDAHLNLGAVLLRLERHDEAEAALRAALEIDGQCALAHFNLGTTLLEANRLADAEAALRRAAEGDPLQAQAWLNLGRALERSQRLDEAEAAYRAGLGARPGDPDLQANLALVLLAKGRYAEGWALYESRFATRHGGSSHPVPGFAFPQWSGASLRGKSLVVLSEQGYGDTLQFCRYLPLLKAKGLKRLTVVCPPALMRLMEGIEEVDACLSLDEIRDMPAHDYWLYMMSLPLRFDTTLDSIPCFVPYLRAPGELAGIWARRLPAAKPKVGLVWAGEVRTGVKTAHAIDKRRSLHARDLLPLLKVPGVTFVSLQLGATTRPQIAELPAALRPFDPMDDVTDFADTAAIIEQLDLVIAVDTSTAHLAGALNRPVWVLSRFDQCWRWLTERDDTPWYPSMRLFRQTQPDDWQSVIARAAQALKTFARADTDKAPERPATKAAKRAARKPAR